MKHVWYKLLVYTVLIGALAGFLTCVVGATFAGIISCTANFWLGVWWAKQNIAHGKMQVPATSEVRYEYGTCYWPNE